MRCWRLCRYRLLGQHQGVHVSQQLLTPSYLEHRLVTIVNRTVCRYVYCAIFSPIEEKIVIRFIREVDFYDT